MATALADLFEVQRKLDGEIVIKHPIKPNEDRFEKKKLALLVEIGELANEQRSWKFWSNNQEPRKTVQCHACKGEGGFHAPFSQSLNYEECMYCGGTGIQSRPLLEEYVDCFHFILSIGNEYANYVPGFYEGYDNSFNECDDNDIEDFPAQFNALFRNASRLGGGVNESFNSEIDIEYYYHTFMLFMGLGDMLGFTWEQITDAYMSKNKTNWDRQANGY